MSCDSRVAWLGLIFGVIALIIAVIVGIYFFVQMSNMENSNVALNIVQAMTDYIAAGVGNTVLLLNPPNDADLTVTITGSQYYNKKGQIFEIVNQRATSIPRVRVVQGPNLLLINNVYYNNFQSLQPGMKITFLFLDNNYLIYTGVTSVT